MERWAIDHNILKSMIFKSKNPYLLRVWLYCLFKANQKDSYDAYVKSRRVPLKKGQFIFGLRRASQDMNISIGSTLKSIKQLQAMEKIHRFIVKPHPNHKGEYSIISILDKRFIEKIPF